MARILPLPQDSISGIQSSKNITSLQGVALSLLQNSLDAGSSKIEISVDFRRGGCTAEDNGSGIASSEFLESGGLGKLYHTSKLFASNDSEFHGSAGTYLASLGALSLLKLTSRHEGSNESATLATHQSKVIRRDVPAAAIDELTLSPSHGTRVTVRDLFGSMPVRVKQRALQTDSGSTDEKAWQELKSGAVALLLAWPKPCSVKLRDVNDDKRKVQLSAQHPLLGNNLTAKSLNQLAGGSVKFELKDALPVLFQAGLAPAESRMRWISLSAASSHISVKGSICLDPAPTRACQFISLGIQPCSTKDGYTDLYDTVNRLFSNSSFGAIEDDSFDIDDEEKDRRARDRRFKQDGLTRKQVQGRKGVDRWPMFVLQIRFKDQNRRSENLSERNLKAMADILEAAVRQWLKTHHFRPRKKNERKPVNSGQSPGRLSLQDISGRSTPATSTPESTPMLDRGTATTSKRRRLLDFDGNLRALEQERNRTVRPASADFKTWSRIKIGNRTLYDEVWEGRKPRTAPESQQGSMSVQAPAKQTPFNLPIVEAGELSSRRKASNASTARKMSTSSHQLDETIPNEDQKTSSDYFGSIDEEAFVDAADEVEQEADRDDVANDAIIEWTDPSTKETFRVNSRTGVVLPIRPRRGGQAEATSSSTSSRTSAAINTTLTSAGLPLTLSKRPSTATGENRKWLPGFLKEWQNPVFTRQDEEPIPVASFDGPGIEVEEAANNRCNHETASMRFNQQSSDRTRKLSKTALRNAKVIRQADRKFILCKFCEAESEVLVLVDQHAASERVILENLLSELCLPVDEAIAQANGSKVKSVHLEKPLRFQISAADFELFRDHSRHFAEWGLLYDLRQRHVELSASQVRPAKEEQIIIVHALPPGIAERCTLFPKLLIELLRAEIHSSSKRTARITGVPIEEAGPHCWLTNIGSCPKGILDMLNSRACRSAIMFNDVLSIEECEDLLKRLGTCAFPFMCAHGRVSCVPVIELGTVGIQGWIGEGERDEGEKKGSSRLSEAFKRWRAKENIVGRPENEVD